MEEVPPAEVDPGQEEVAGTKVKMAEKWTIKRYCRLSDLDLPFLSI